MQRATFTFLGCRPNNVTFHCIELCVLFFSMRWILNLQRGRVVVATLFIFRQVMKR